MGRHLIKLILVFVCLIAAVLIVAFIVAAIPSSYTPAPLPNPNGYPGLINAGQTVAGNGSTNLSESQLEALVQSHSAALQLVRSNLSEQMQVPVAYTMAYGTTHIPELMETKQIALALQDEGHLAVLQHRPADAAKADLDIIELGIKSPRGAPLIDALVGDAIENIGVSELRKLTGTLDGAACKNAARRLEEIEAQKQTWKEVLQNEHYWTSRAYPAWQRVVSMIAEYRAQQMIEKTTEKKYEAVANNARQLIIALAARAFTLDNGHPPAATTDLVPNYLKAVPLDAATGSNMTYLPQETR